MKKYYILFLTLFCLPLWAGAFSLPETEKLFEDSLKHCSIREKEYYSKEQSEFILNNF